MKKIRTILLATVMFIILCAVGNTVYAKTWTAGQAPSYTVLAEGDTLTAGCHILDADYVELDGERIKTSWSDSLRGNVYVVEKDVTVIGIEEGVYGSYAPSPEGGEPEAEHLVRLKTIVPETVGGAQTTLSPEEAWKRSPQNPKNYLPEVTLADGSTVESTVPAHFMSGKDGGVSAVFSTTALGDFYRALGVSGGNGVHMYSYKSLCGPLMRQLFADHAAALGTEVTVADIFEMQTEIRDKNYKLVEVVTESSEAVDIVIGLQGDLLKAAEDGSDFAVLVYADGEVTVCADTDEEVSTLTISTTKTSGIYAIVYAPAGTFAE